MKILSSFAVLFCLIFSSHFAKASHNRTGNKVIVYPCPLKEMLSSMYHVYASGKSVPIYTAKVGAADDVRRFKAVDDLMHSDDYFDTAAFGYFDLQGTSVVKVSINQSIKSVKILPTSAQIKFKIINNTVIFTVARPQNLTIELNGEWVKSLHIFVNPIEQNKPKPGDRNVIYYGPGVHNLTNLIIRDNTTLYIDGGAVVKIGIGAEEKYGIEPSGLKNYSPRLILSGNNIRLCGRGILDASACPTHSANFTFIAGNDIKVEGVIFLNSPSWTVPLRQTNRATVDNVKIIGYRANSDGIDICNSTNTIIKNCFVRTNDDLIVVKTWENAGPSSHIIVNKCVLWNQLANALSIGAELRENVNDVLFSNCDIIHDQSREWTFHIFQTDDTKVSNIKFLNINVEESKNLISLWIGKIPTSYNGKSGSIDGVSFENIKVKGINPAIVLSGNSSNNIIKDVFFYHVFINGLTIKNMDVKHNEFVDGVNVENN